jgi:hypothetical protein
MVWPPLANTFVAFKKSDIRMPESSIRMRSGAVMPWRCAISNTSAMAHSTRARFGSACGWYCPILFIVTVYKGLHFRKTNAGRVQKCLLRAFSKLHSCIFEFRPIRLSNRRCTKIANKRSQTKDLQFGSSPLCRDTPTLSVQKCTLLWPDYTFTILVGKTGLLKNRHPTTDTDRVFRSQHVACQRRLHRCLRDQQP